MKIKFGFQDKSLRKVKKKILKRKQARKKITKKSKGSPNLLERIQKKKNQEEK